MPKRTTSSFFVALLPMLAGRGAAASEAPKSGAFVEAHGGPAFAMYPAQDPGAPNEHLVTGAQQWIFGGGYGIALGRARVDLGLRLQVQAISVLGRYDAETKDDDFRATYIFLAPLVRTGLVVRLSERFGVLGGVSLGTATFFSERLGARTRVEQIPFYGSFEVGAEVALAEWVAARVTLAWQPPLGGPNVLSPMVGFRSLF